MENLAGCSLLLLCACLCFAFSDAVLLADNGYNTDPAVLSALSTVLSRVGELEMYFEEGCFKCGGISRPPLTNPAFMATLSHATSCQPDDQLVFDKVRLNSGGGYNSSSGSFTAPSNGTYFFSATVTAEPQTSFHIKFVQNSLTEEVGYVFGGDKDNYTQQSTSFVVHLHAGDMVGMACTGHHNSTIQGGNNGAQHEFHSHFSGFRINDE